MKIKIRITIAVLLSSIGTTLAQQEPQFAQYFDNTLLVNPAYAGSKGILNAMAIHREQWVGFEGRPRSTTFSLQSPLSYESVGLGLTLVNDVVGPLQQTMVYSDFSYSLKFSGDRKLAFGLKAGADIINIGSSSLQPTNESDPVFLQSVYNKVSPNFGLGIYYHTPRFFIGASSPKLVERTYTPQDKTTLERRHFFGIAGLVFNTGRMWKIRPTTQLKLTNGAPLSLDLSVAGIYDDKFYIGAMYRLDAATGIFIQYQLSPQFKAGLATEFGAQEIRKYNDGTFELMLSYDFVFKKIGVRSPRYF
ncbi:MAG: type IX secretion system PorP/SprF family membrane protein [Lentimonas sp.]|jgi:type IX secretion system PorP/SprF family membrane protein